MIQIKYISNISTIYTMKKLDSKIDSYSYFESVVWWYFSFKYTCRSKGLINNANSHFFSLVHMSLCLGYIGQSGLERGEVLLSTPCRYTLSVVGFHLCKALTRVRVGLRAVATSAMVTCLSGALCVKERVSRWVKESMSALCHWHSKWESESKMNEFWGRTYTNWKMRGVNAYIS